MLQLNKTYLLFLIIVFLFSCRKSNDFENLNSTQWNPTLAVPLINSTISVEKFITSDQEHEIIQVGSENEIYLIYQSEIISIKGADLFDLPDLSGIINSETVNFTFPFSGQQKIGKIGLKSGKMNYVIQSQSTDSAEITFSIPFAEKNGQNLEEVIEIGGSQGTYKSGTFDLSGYEFDLTGGGSLYNEFTIETLIELISGGLGDFNDYSIFLGFQDLFFEYVEGFFGNLNFGFTGDTLVLPLFEQWTEGSFQLFDPQIAFEIENSFGIPLSATFSTFDVTDDLEGQNIIPIETTIDLGDTMEVSFPNLSNIGGSENTEILFDENNSNLTNIISFSPKQLRYSLYFVSSLVIDSSAFNFMLDDSFFKVNMDLRLPMKGQIDQVVIQDTFNFTASTAKLFETINTARFRLETINNLPLGLDLQLYFADENDEILDSLLASNETILKAASVDGQGKVISPENQINFIDFDKNTASNIDNAKKVIARILINTSENGNVPVTFYTDYFLGMKLGVITNINLN